jgi:NADPH-dependent 2,4-dienoyl-CoA reductase/sulfur reductase-like enzyme
VVDGRNAVAERLVIVGASRAGLFAAEGARRAGYEGPITMLGAEPHLPYDRPPLSKEFLAADEDTSPAPPYYRSIETLRQQLRIDVRVGSPATSLDTEARTVIAGDQSISYSALVIATGTTARRLPGASHLEGVLTLRTLDDGQRLRAALDSSPRTVVIGAGLIGSEVAAAVCKRGLPVTIVEPMPVPLCRVVGEQSGKVCADLHDRNGTTLRAGVSVSGLRGRRRVEEVVLSDGSRISADLVVVGIGVIPEVEWLRDSGLRLDNGLVCDATLNAGLPGVYGAGDVVCWPNGQPDRLVRLETWTSAAEQGRIAGHNAARPGEAMTFSTVSYMWSDQYGSRLQFIGDAAADEIVTVDGVDVSVARPVDRHLALYRRGDRLIGAFGLNQPRLIPKLRAMIGRGAAFDDAVRACRG